MRAPAAAPGKPGSPPHSNLPRERKESLKDRYLSVDRVAGLLGAPADFPGG